MARLSAHVLKWARRGAEHRFEELKAELAALLKVFPHLRYGSAVSPAMPDGVEEGRTRVSVRPRMSVEARRAVSKRMRAYWAARRKAKQAASAGRARVTARDAKPAAMRRSTGGRTGRTAAAERPRRLPARPARGTGDALPTISFD